MPIDLLHAFAQGNLFTLDEAKKYRKSLWAGRFYRMINRWLMNRKMIEVSGSFINGSTLGRGCKIGPNSWCVNRGEKSNIQIGNESIIRGILRCENWNPAKLIIEDMVYIGDDCLISCSKEIRIGRYSMLAHGVQLFDNDSHPIDSEERIEDYRAVLGKKPERSFIESAPIQIGEKVWVGFNSIVLKGVTIGEGSVIAAGSLVVRDIPPYTLAAGNPARVIKSIKFALEK